MTATTITREICGTHRGYYKHRKNGEPRCQPCKDAYAIHQQDYRTDRANGVVRTVRTQVRADGVRQPRISTPEIVAEIRHLMSLGQGHAYILRAVGYAGREAVLKNRLQRPGYGDVYNELMGVDPENQPGPLSRRGLLRA